MEWKNPFQCDWENQSLFSSSELGNSSSKSSISASNDYSLNSRIKPVEDMPKCLNMNKDLAKAEPLIGLKLGKRTYFEDVGVGNNNMTKNSNSSTTIVSPTVLVKRTRASQQSVTSSHCQVEGCNVDLSGARSYHRKHKVCESHSKCPKVVVAGQERRFCQQCSRFHSLSEFDHKKRSCRKRLSDHNARRRKPQAEIISFNSSSFSSPCYDDRQKMNFLLNRSPFAILRQSTSSTWEDSCGFSLTHSIGYWTNKSTEVGLEERNPFSNPVSSNSIPSLALDLDKLLPFRGRTPEILSQGIEASIIASSLDQSAPSLLSTDSCVSSNIAQSNLSQHFANTNNNEMDGCWKGQPTLPQQAHTSLPQHARVLPFEFQNNSTQYETPFLLSESDYYKVRW